jgi:hypothetical protein
VPTRLVVKQDIQEDQRLRALTYARAVLEAMQPTPDGGTAMDFRASGGVDPLYAAPTRHRLIAMLTMEYPPELRGVAALIVSDALRSLRQHTDAPDWSALSQAITAAHQAYFARRPTSFRLLFPLNVTTGAPATRRTIRVLDDPFHRASWSRIQRTDGWSELVSRASATYDLSRGSPLLRHTTPLLLDVKAPSSADAFRRGLESFELLRATLNFPVTAFRVSWCVGRPSPLARVRAAPFYGVFDADWSHQGSYIAPADVTSGPMDVRGEHWSQTLRILRQLRASRITDGLRAILIRVLGLYQDALDSTEWRMAFLCLWQAVEALTLQSRMRVDMREITKRLHALLGRKDVDADVVEYLRQVRNPLVHEGVFSDADGGLQDVNVLKVVVERGIETMLGNARTLYSVERWGAFYDLVARDHRRLADCESVARYIRRVEGDGI